MYGILMVFHVLVAVMLIGLILMQHGKGAQTGASFGSGASQTVFGSQGSGGFLSRATGWLAAAFFILNLLLVYWINSESRQVLPPTRAPIEKHETPAQETPSSGAATTGSDVPDVKN